MHCTQMGHLMPLKQTKQAIGKTGPEGRAISCSVKGVMCTDTLSTLTSEPRGPFVWLQYGSELLCRESAAAGSLLPSWYFKKPSCPLGEWSTLSYWALSKDQWPPAASLEGVRWDRGSRESVLGQTWGECIREVRVSEAVLARVFPTDLCQVLWKKGLQPC